MCVIAYKPKGQELPSNKTLKQCFEANPHGAGLMVARGGAVELRKGFMNYGDFKKALDKMAIKKDEAAVLHFRIATAGGVKPENCHPFPLTSKTGELKATERRCDVGVAHNGIIPLQAKDGMSDTMTFIRDLFSRKAIFENRNEPGVKFLLDEFVGNSKIIVLHGSGEAEFFGIPQAEWFEHEGCLFSNDRFLPAATAPAVAAPVRRLSWYDKAAGDVKAKAAVKYERPAYKTSPKFSGFVNEESICPKCARSTYKPTGNGDARKCDWCGYGSNDEEGLEW